MTPLAYRNIGHWRFDMWQKWLGRGLIAVNAIVLAVCAFFQVEVTWWQPVMVAATGLVNILIGLFPPK
jgi:hypothetical protein